MVDFDRASVLIQKRTEMGMRSVVLVLRGDLSQMDETDLTVNGIDDDTAHIVYSGKAHVHNVNGAGVLPIGDTTIDTRTVQISIPFSVTQMPRRDDLVVVANDNDQDVQSRTFRVMDVQAGGLLNPCYTLTCQGWGDSRYYKELEV